MGEAEVSAIHYTNSLDGIAAGQSVGFFEGWLSPPSPEQHLAILHGSSEIVLALSDDRAVGFITAVTDGALAAYIPLLEVRHDVRGQGIGKQLASRMLRSLTSF